MRVGDARGERRQPERERARQRERDERVEARLGHGRALDRHEPHDAAAGPERAHAHDDAAVPRRREREPHAGARRAGVRGARDDAPVAQQRHA